MVTGEYRDRSCMTFFSYIPHYSPFPTLLPHKSLISFFLDIGDNHFMKILETYNLLIYLKLLKGTYNNKYTFKTLC